MALSAQRTREGIPGEGVRTAVPGVRGGARRFGAASRAPVSLPRGGGISAAVVTEFKERRHRRRVPLQPMYTMALVRALGRRGEPLDGHVINLSETGLVVEIDELLPVGQPVALEFTIAGLGQSHRGQWSTFQATGEVVRADHLDDFPAGPYDLAIRFEHLPTIIQAQIARFIMTMPPSPSAPIQ